MLMSRKLLSVCALPSCGNMIVLLGDPLLARSDPLSPLQARGHAQLISLGVITCTSAAPHTSKRAIGLSLHAGPRSMKALEHGVLHAHLIRSSRP